MRVAPVLVPGEKPQSGAATARTVVDGGAIANYFTGISEILGPPFVVDWRAAGIKRQRSPA
jgi:hypothetical protein